MAGQQSTASQAQRLRERTKRFALELIRLHRSLPRTDATTVIGRQVLRSGTSIAANYWAVCRARSRAEFVAKLGVVVEEADETVLWLELLSDGHLVDDQHLQPLLSEARELLAIFAASQRTARLSSRQHFNGTMNK